MLLTGVWSGSGSPRSERGAASRAPALHQSDASRSRSENGHDRNQDQDQDQAAPLPNFYLIGGKKCGTTALFRRLDAHPDIAFPYKEIHYFTYAGKAPPVPNVVTEWADYQRLFEPLAGMAVRGDASPSYLHIEEAAPRIRDATPDAKIAAVLRHPVDRMFSDYLHERMNRREPAATFAEALRAEANGESRRQLYRLKSTYSVHLRRYQGLFPAEQLCFLVYEEAQGDAPTLARELYRFLAVDDTFDAGRDLRTRTSGLPKSRAVSWAFRHSGPARALAKSALPRDLYARVGYGLYNRNVERQVLPAELRAQLLDDLADEITEVEHILGRPLPAWRR